MDPGGENEVSQRYHDLRRRVMEEVHRALDEEVDFAITVDDGGKIAGYEEIVRIEDDA